jgi:hypothetical protein
MTATAPALKHLTLSGGSMPEMALDKVQLVSAILSGGSRSKS